MSHKFTKLAVFFSTFIFATGFAFAEEETNTGTRFDTLKNRLEEQKAEWERRKEEIERKRLEWERTREEWKNRRAEIKENRCEALTERIDARTNRFDENKDWHLQNYNNLKDRIGAFVTKMDEAGLDTSDLKEHLKELESLINAFAADFKAYIDKLKETRGYACGHTEGGFKAKLEEAKVLRQKVHEDARKIREYIRTVIKEDLKELKEQRREMKKNDEITEGE